MVEKADLLRAIDDLGEPTAQEVADTLYLDYHEAAVALLRATRGGLVHREREASDEPYRYALTTRGEERLSFLDEEDSAEPDELDDGPGGELGDDEDESPEEEDDDDGEDEDEDDDDAEDRGRPQRRHRA